VSCLPISKLRARLLTLMPHCAAALLTLLLRVCAHAPAGIARQLLWLCVDAVFGNASLLPAAEDRQMENQPRNILEEIVWHKAVEVGRWRCECW
jgi:hypothetical protein